MATMLLTVAVEESTYIVVAAYKNEAGTAMTPATATWTLTDIAGTVINSREDVALTPGTTNTIVLTGDDLAVTATGPTRVVTVKATYNSDYGTGLFLKAAAEFQLEDLLGV